MLREASILAKSHELAVVASGEDARRDLHVLTTGSNVEARLFASFGRCAAVEIDNAVPRSYARVEDDDLGRGAKVIPCGFLIEPPKISASLDLEASSRVGPFGLGVDVALVVQLHLGLRSLH